MSLEILIIGLPRIGVPPPRFQKNELFISRKLLEFHLRLVQQMGFRFTTLQDAVSKKAGKFAVITFDSGYADILTEGLLVLRTFRAPATVFVITGDVGKKRVSLDKAVGRGVDDLSMDFLSWENLKFLRGEEWEVGSHNKSRIQLSGLSAADQEESILLSIEEIRCRLGVEPVSFAYPYGDFQPATKKILKGCGIKYAVTTKPTKSMKFDEKTDLFELPRLWLVGGEVRHYLKNLLRISKVAGVASTLRGLVKMWRGNALPVILESSFISSKQEKHP